MTAQQWTFAEAERCTLPDAFLLVRYWTRYPPLHIVLGSLFGSKKAPKPTMEELMGMPGAVNG